MRTLEPGHRLNPDGIGPISASVESPILISSVLSETPLGHRYRAKQGDRALIVSTYERRHLADAVLAGRLELGLGAATSAAHLRLMSTHGFNLSGVLPFAVGDDPRCTTVTQFLERRLAKAKMPSVRTAMRLIDQLCEALDYLHPQMVHGFITPDNTFVDSRGSLTLMGLGEGYAALRSPDFARMVTEGRLPHPGREMSPDGKPTVATDVYMVAAYFVQVLTGRPYASEAQIDALRTTFHADGVGLVRRALHPDPDLRPQTIAEFREGMSDAFQKTPKDGMASRMSRVSHASSLADLSAGANREHSQSHRLPQAGHSYPHPVPQPGVPGAVTGATPSGGISLASAEKIGAHSDPYAGTSIGPAVNVDMTPHPGPIPGVPARVPNHGTPPPPPHGVSAPPPPPPPQRHGQMGNAPTHYGQQAPHYQEPYQPPYQQHPQYGGPPHGGYGPGGGATAYAPQYQAQNQAQQNHANHPSAVPAQVQAHSSSLNLGLGSGSLGDLRLQLSDVDGSETDQVLGGDMDAVDLSSPLADSGYDDPELGHTGDGPGVADELDPTELAMRLSEEDAALRCYLAVRDGIEFGPFSLNQLKRQARDGELSSVDALINRQMDQEFMAADHPALRPIFLRLAKQREAHDAQTAFENERKRIQRAHTLDTLKWVLLAVAVFGGAGLFLWLKNNGL